MFRQHQITVKQVRNCSNRWGISASSALSGFGYKWVANSCIPHRNTSHQPDISPELVNGLGLQMKMFCTWTCPGAPGMLCVSYLMKSFVLKSSFRLVWLCLIKRRGKNVHSSWENVSHTALGWACERSWAHPHQCL